MATACHRHFRFKKATLAVNDMNGVACLQTKHLNGMLSFLLRQFINGGGLRNIKISYFFHFSKLLFLFSEFTVS